MRIIISTNINEEIMIDDEDYEEVNKYKWLLKSTMRGGNRYVITHQLKDERGNYTTLSRFLMKEQLTDSNLRVAFKDKNTLNCCKSNLVVCSSGEIRRMNNRPKEGNKYVGISLDKKRNKWRSEIAFKGKKVYIGFFETKEEAAAAYNLKALELYQDKAIINEVEEPKGYGNECFGTKPRCTVCGMPLAKGETEGIHKGCDTNSAAYLKGIYKDLIPNLKLALGESRRRLDERVVHWNSSMGKEELIKMFPDMIERI